VACAAFWHAFLCPLRRSRWPQKINDTKGHEIGSDFIREATDFLQQVVRRTDIVGRVGGDEFVVAGKSDEEDIRVVANRLRVVGEERNAQLSGAYPFSLSLGHVSSSDSESLQELVQQADIAMYEANHRKQSLLANPDSCSALPRSTSVP